MRISWDWQLLGCHRRGIQAHKSGEPITACPYNGRRGLNRQRAEYWRDGWKSSDEDKAYAEQRALREVSEQFTENPSKIKQ